MQKVWACLRTPFILADGTYQRLCQFLCGPSQLLSRLLQQLLKDPVRATVQQYNSMMYNVQHTTYDIQYTTYDNTTVQCTAV